MQRLRRFHNDRLKVGSSALLQVVPCQRGRPLLSISATLRGHRHPFHELSGADVGATSRELLRTREKVNQGAKC